MKAGAEWGEVTSPESGWSLDQRACKPQRASLLHPPEKCGSPAARMGKQDPITSDTYRTSPPDDPARFSWSQASAFFVSGDLPCD